VGGQLGVKARKLKKKQNPSSTKKVWEGKKQKRTLGGLQYRRNGVAGNQVRSGKNQQNGDKQIEKKRKLGKFGDLEWPESGTERKQKGQKQRRKETRTTTNEEGRRSSWAEGCGEGKGPAAKTHHKSTKKVPGGKKVGGEGKSAGLTQVWGGLDEKECELNFVERKQWWEKKRRCGDGLSDRWSVGNRVF